MNLRIFVCVTLLVLTSNCAIRKNLVTAFNPVNQPILNDGGGTNPSNGTKYCSPDASGSFSEGPVTPQTVLNGDGSATSQGGGCVLRPIREVWAVFNNTDILKWQAITGYTYTRQINPTSSFTHLYAMNYSIDTGTPIGTITLLMDWYEGFDQGTFLDPQQVNIEYSRVSGTSNIPTWNGGFVLTKVNDSVTSVAILNTFKARQSDSANETSAEEGLNEMMGDARNATPNWTNLNTGFKADPSVPDPAPSGGPAVAGPYCVKNSSGQYPSTSDVATGTTDGVSWVKIRACLTQPLAAVLQATKDPATIHWNNSESAVSAAQPQSSPSNPVTVQVTYQASKWLVLKSSWIMTWQYTTTDGQNGNPSSASIAYNMDPATSDFPVWQGTLAVTGIDTSVTEVDIDNEMLTNEVSDSLSTNQSVSQGLLTSIQSQFSETKTDSKTQ